MKIIHDLPKVLIQNIQDVYKQSNYFNSMINILVDSYRNDNGIDNVEKEIFLITLLEIKEEINLQCLSNGNFRLLLIVIARFSLLHPESIKHTSISK